MKDIASNFKFNYTDARIGKKLIELEETPEAVKYFSKNCHELTNYGYWFFLSTIWISYSGHSDINLWRELFASNRSEREISIMKPSERKAYKRLPYFVTAYRAHRENETQWLSYTTDMETAYRFARERNVDQISEYKIKRQDAIGYFLRRGESELIVIDQNKAELIRRMDIPGGDL